MARSRSHPSSFGFDWFFVDVLVVMVSFMSVTVHVCASGPNRRAPLKQECSSPDKHPTLSLLRSSTTCGAPTITCAILA